MWCVECFYITLNNGFNRRKDSTQNKCGTWEHECLNVCVCVCGTKNGENRVRTMEKTGKIGVLYECMSPSKPQSTSESIFPSQWITSLPFLFLLLLFSVFHVECSKSFRIHNTTHTQQINAYRAQTQFRMLPKCWLLYTLCCVCVCVCCIAYNFHQTLCMHFLLWCVISFIGIRRLKWYFLWLFVHVLLLLSCSCLYLLFDFLSESQLDERRVHRISVSNAISDNQRDK